jgi:heme/copper-type cytochrome/quinol oxidase subunit 3
MHALPPAPTPAPRRQLFVGTSLACAAGLLLYGTMIAMFVGFRKTTLAVPDSVWKPAKSVVPEVATNIMLISFLAIYVFVQWAVYAARRDHKSYVGLSIGLTVVVAIAVINAQAFTWFQMNLGVRDGTYQTLFYAVTGTFLVLMIIGVVFSLVTVFRYLGGRTKDREIVTAHAIYWYFVGAAFVALWFAVYVTK